MIDKASVVILAIILVALCFVAKEYGIEGFDDIVKINAQGSYNSPNTFNPGTDVETWRINKNLYEPGTAKSLNFSSIQSAFPYNRNLPEFYNEDDIGLIKSDGVIVGGYMPQILRPFDNVTANPVENSDCKWPCYSDKKFQKWCSEKNAIEYHAMRPIISSNAYYNNLKKMFKLMIDKKGPAGNPRGDLFEQINTAVFCTETQQALMSWLMQKIAITVDKMPEMQRNGSWKSERFVDTDVDMYQYVTADNNTYFKIIFNLFNPLRSVATMVVATIYLVNGNPSLVDMAFVNEGTMEDFMAPQNGFGAINGHNFDNDITMPDHLGYQDSPDGTKQWEENTKKNPNEFDWNYQNTLEVQKFNKNGFYSNVPGDNISIEGGIPDSLKKTLRNNSCNQEQLMSCMMPGYTGVLGASAKSLNQGLGKVDDAFAKLDGTVKNVYASPNLVYNNNPMSIRGIETVSGMVYV